MATVAMPVPQDRTETAPERIRVRSFGLALVGLLAVLTAAWGGIVPYVGPLFGYGGDGSSSWHWNTPHAVLALIPGALGVFLGLVVVGEARGVVIGRGRITLATAGTLLMVVGAWFAIGPYAWPVLASSGPYFVTGTHLRVLAYEVGYSIGTGIILVVCGAFVDGWAARHQPRLIAVAAASEAPAEAGASTPSVAAASEVLAESPVPKPTAVPSVHSVSDEPEAPPA
jgi:hypothetical protein